jgi:hypothetical protein
MDGRPWLIPEKLLKNLDHVQMIDRAGQHKLSGHLGGRI